MNGDHCRSESHNEKLQTRLSYADTSRTQSSNPDKQTVKISACLLRLSCSLHTEVKSTCSRSSAWSIDGCLIRRWVTAGVAADKSLWWRSDGLQPAASWQHWPPDDLLSAADLKRGRGRVTSFILMQLMQDIKFILPHWELQIYSRGEKLGGNSTISPFLCPVCNNYV